MSQAPLYGAIEAGGTKFMCAVAREPLQLLAETRIATTTPAATLDAALAFFAQQELVHGKLAGIGMGHYVESSIGSPKERAEIRIMASGRTTCVIGTQPSGQGHETSFAQVVAERLGLPVDSVEIVLGDTAIVSVGGGSHSGRSMRHAGTVISKGSDQLIEKAKAIAAILLRADKSEMVWEDGRIAQTGTNHSFDMYELARAIDGVPLPDDLADGLFMACDNEMHEPVFPNGCAICEIEVDPDTGVFQITRYAAVDDVGRCINPMIVHGQTHGGIVQGVGQAIGELCALDPTSGQPIAASLMDYFMPRADDMPSFRTEIAEVLSPTNPLGVKAGGEGGTTPALSTIVNALVDALQDYGVRDLQMPTTPISIWRAIQQGKKTKAQRENAK